MSTENSKAGSPVSAASGGSTARDLIHAPFDEDQLRGLREWQASGMVHPFTCCDHQTMRVERHGFVCPKCGGVQTWAHAFMAQGAPPSLLSGL